jgi:peptide/nickel transport system permease protein
MLDELIMRIVDTFLAFPGLLLALGISGLFGAGFTNMVLALIIVEWTSYARLARSSVIDIKEHDYVTASRGLGAKDSHIIIHHIVPNIISPLIVMATIGMGYAILASAGLSFLGFGVQPPTPEWGSMLTDGRTYIRSAPYVMIFPGLAIMAAVLAFNYLGDAFRDMLDPRKKRNSDM